MAAVVPSFPAHSLHRLSRTPVGLAAVLVAATAANVGLLELGAALSYGSMGTGLWLPAGLNVGLVFLLGLRVGPAIVAANVLALGFPLPAKLLIGATAVAAAAAGAAVLRGRISNPAFTRPRDVFLLALAVAPAAAGIGAAGGTAALALFGVVEPGSAPGTALTWLLGDYAGVLLGAPLALSLMQPPPADCAPARTWEPAALAVTVTLTAVVTHATGLGGGVMLMPAVVWAGLRFGPRAAAVTAATVGLFQVAFAAAGHAPLVQGGAAATIVTVHGYLVITALVALALAAVSADRRRATGHRRESEARMAALASEHAALHRITAAIAREEPESEVMRLVAIELGTAFGVDATAVFRVDADGQTTITGWWAVPGAPRLPTGTMFASETYAEHLQPLATGRAVTVVGPTGPPSVHAYVKRVFAPVRLGGGLWGAICVAGLTEDAVPPEAEERLEQFAELVGLAIDNAQTREMLRAQATTDPLTGLVNHRTFHEALQIEAHRARRHGRSLSVAVFDIDNFKTINDSRGHLAGDEVLRQVARVLRSSVRRGDIAGRLGGDEIAVLQPETCAAGAEAMAKKIRAAVVRAGDAGVPVTLSAGVCDLDEAGGDPERMLSLADGALYWAKFQGRNACVRYSPDVVEELSASERTERLQRSQQMAGLRSLAGAIDAKDHLTEHHAERVADLAVALARSAGWPEAAAVRMRDAALLHDVGKVGVPDSILATQGPLTQHEYDVVKTHASLSAEIAGEVLDAEQVSWVRGHHERPDGLGYPDGLSGDALSEGAALLALAEAWESMTGERSYSPGMSVEAALQECRQQRGRQFTAGAVKALQALVTDGLLEDAVPVHAAA